MSSWCNGRLLPSDAIRIDPNDRGFTLGDGVFETVRIRNGVALHLDRHLVRLRHGAAVLGIPVLHDDPELEGAIVAVARDGRVEEGAARITLSRGIAPRGIGTPRAMRPTHLVTAQAMPPATTALTLMTATTTRRNEHSPLSRIKSLNYLDGVIARREAEAQGIDDALLLNTAGLVAEGSVASLIALSEDRLWTPRLVDGALPGIARSLLLEAGLLAETPMTPHWLSSVDALFLCNSLGVRPVSRLDGCPLTSRSELLLRLSMALAGPPPHR